MKRITSIDVTRGIVMIIMALDHTRDLLHTDSLTQQPTDLATTTPILFFTRFITHLCAPTFVFLAGVSAFLSCQKGESVGANRNFLLSRGIALLIMEFTLVNFSMFFDLHFPIFLFEVIAAIGFGFVVLGLMLRLPSTVIGIIGLLIFCLHDLAPLIPFSKDSLFQKTLMSLFLPTAFPLGGDRLFIMSYTPVPWLGILLLGFWLGKLFLLPQTQKRTYFIRIGISFILLFVALRFLNRYGDFPWATQKSEVLTFLSFFNVTKYPPSLQFGLLMLGGMFIILYCVEGVTNRFTGIVSVYGKVPFFYFVVHWYILHCFLFIMVFLQGYHVSDLVFGFNFGRPKGPSGVSLPIVYCLWICVVVIMYPLCKWYGRVKGSNRYKWLRYL